MKKVGVILSILALFGSSMAKADDEKDFYRQIEGWEWIYQEPCKRENIEYPKSVSFYTYDSHPEYRVTKREFYNIWGGFEEFLVCIYDGEGKLVRVSCLLDKQTVELETYDSYIRRRREFFQNQWRILGKYLVNNAEKQIEQLLQPTKDFYFAGNYWQTKEFDKYFNSEQLPDSVILKDNPFPKDFRICIGNAYSRKKWKDKRKTTFEGLIQSSIQDSSHIQLSYIFKDREDDESRPSSYEIYASVDEAYYDSICHAANSDVNHYKFKKHETLVIKKVKDKLLNRMMVESYCNNKYDIKNREPLEILNVIEERLGLKEPQEVNETNIIIEMVCELLRVNYYQGITRNDVVAQLKDKYPYKDDMDIQNMILEAFTEASTVRLLSLNAETEEKKKIEQPATNYINQLEKDHINDNEISSIERTDHTSFKITFNTKTSKSKFYAYVWFYSDEPYSYKFKIDIKAD